MSKPELGASRIVAPRPMSRRRLLASVPALGGLLATGCADALVPPTVRGGLIGAADVLTMSTTRLLMADQPLAREYERSDIEPDFPTWGQTNPDNEDYQRHQAILDPLIGFVGATFAAIAIVVLYAQAASQVAQIVSFLPITTDVAFVRNLAVFTILVGLVVGSFGSYFSVRRYLSV